MSAEGKVPPNASSTSPASTRFRWLRSGNEAFGRMLEAIDLARETVDLETYTFEESVLGERFRQALIAACRRGVRVRVVLDFIGSRALLGSFWNTLVEAGGQFCWFNPWNLLGLGIRDHRKILVCDGQRAFIGGFNIAPCYEGDGILSGWRDLGIEIEGNLSSHLAACVARSYALANFRFRPWHRFRRGLSNDRVTGSDWTLLLSGPGRGRRYLRKKLISDIAKGRSIRVVSAYFLPTWRIRRALVRAVRRGGRVQLILAGKSDVALSQWASRCLYERLLRAGVEIHEYQPQILHAKLIVIDDHVYVGSANLDARSLMINYELMLRVKQAAVVNDAKKLIYDLLKHSVEISWESWRRNRPLWRRWFERIAYWILARLDPYLAQLKRRELP